MNYSPGLAGKSWQGTTANMGYSSGAGSKCICVFVYSDAGNLPTPPQNSPPPTETCVIVPTTQKPPPQDQIIVPLGTERKERLAFSHKLNRAQGDK